jgi:hypothetical protein
MKGKDISTSKIQEENFQHFYGNGDAVLLKALSLLFVVCACNLKV